MAGPAAITAGASLLSGMMGNKGAEASANRAAATQEAITRRATQLYDALFQGAEKADQAGTFDYRHREAMMGSQGRQALGVAQRELAGNALAAGNQPGDSTVTDSQNALSLRYAQGMAANSDALRQQSFWDRQNAYSSAAAAGGMLGQAQNNAFGQQQLAYSRMQSPAGMIGSMMPFFAQRSNGFGGMGGGTIAGYDPNNPYGFGPGSGGAGPTTDWTNYWDKYKAA